MNKELRNLKKALYGHYEVVAKKAGVSKSTVSLVLNGDLSIKETTRYKVISAATEVREQVEKNKQANIKRITKLLAQQ